MIDRTTKLRWRRRVRRSKQQVEEFGTQAEVGLEKHFFNRLSRLTKVRRFIASWALLFLLLIGLTLYQTRGLGKYYLRPTPTAGGIYSEGILGTFTNANPLYAASSVDNSVERLVFAGLFKYDQNNQLVGDMASSWHVDKRGTTYTVKLKPNLLWHDGKPLTADDVVFTYNIIQNPDAKSPLVSSWQGIQVSKEDDLTVKFVLPSILTAFPNSMTNGLVPKHILDGVPTTQLRSLSFNTTQPVGSGPYKWEAAEVVGNDPENREQRIGLIPNPDYVGGKPKIEKFIIRTFQDEKKLAQAFTKQQVNAVAGLTTVPEELKNDLTAQAYNVPLTSEVLVFFKTTEPPFDNIQVRRALSYAVSPNQILGGLDQPVLPVTSPLLRNQIGYDPNIKQNSANLDQAKKILDDAGWRLNDDNQRVKAGKKLQVTLTTQRNSSYDYVAHILKQQWQAAGVTVDVNLLESDDLQQALTNHAYSALLYGISLGADPDVFAYWHSSQAVSSATRLNFSEYKSAVVDKALEAGRTRNEPSVRTIKYQTFLSTWRDDAPAIALYQPRYLYVVRQPLFGFSPTVMNSGADRFNNVVNWTIRETNQAID